MSKPKPDKLLWIVTTRCGIKRKYAITEAKALEQVRAAGHFVIAIRPGTPKDYPENIAAAEEK